MPTRTDLSGIRFGRLTAIEFHSRGPGRVSLWLCRCDCGNEIVARAGNLVSGRSRSCGCVGARKAAQRLTKHGLHGHPLYRIWVRMRDRCNRPSNSRYARYGARGIRVCEEWNDPTAFIAWALSNGYEPGLQIDRINNDGHYEPSNCRFVTQQQNVNNRECTRKFRGEAIADVARKNGVSYWTALARLKRGVHPVTGEVVHD